MTTQEAARPRKQPLARRLTGALGWLLALGLLGWVARQLGMGLARVPSVTVDWGWLAVSFVGLFGAIALGCECWRRWVLAAGAPLAYRAAFCVLYRSNLAKYLPGAGWHFLGRVVLAQREGVPAWVASLAILMDVVGHLAGALAFGLVCAWATGEAPAGSAVVGLALLLCGLHPRLLNFALGTAGRLLAHEMPGVSHGYGTVLAMCGLYVLDWLLIGCGFVAFARAFTPGVLPLTSGVGVAGALAVAWSAGALALFAPAGLGVREAALTALLQPFLPLGVCAVVALASRVWFMLGEVVAFAVAMAWQAPRQGASHAERDAG